MGVRSEAVGGLQLLNKTKSSHHEVAWLGGSYTWCPIWERERGISEGQIWLSSPLLPHCWLEQEYRFGLREKFHFFKLFSQVWVQATPIGERKCLQTACSKEEGRRVSQRGIFQLLEGDSTDCSALISGHQGIDKHGEDCRNYEMKLLLSLR